MPQPVALPLQARCLHNFRNAFVRVDLEDRAGLHPIRREPFQKIFRHHDLAFASRLGDGRWNRDRSALEIDRAPQKPFVEFCAAQSAERNQRKLRHEILVSHIQ